MKTSRPRSTRSSSVALLLTITLLMGSTGILVPSVGAYVTSTRRSEVSRELLSIAQTFQRHRQDVGRWPTPSGGPKITTLRAGLSTFESLYANQHDLDAWSGPYWPHSPDLAEAASTRTQTSLQPAWLDPWGQPYEVCSFARGFDDTRGGMMVLSAGPDGIVQSDDGQVFNVRPGGDDLVQLITFNLR